MASLGLESSGAEDLRIVRRGRICHAEGLMTERDSMHAYYCDRAPYMAKSLEIAPSGQVVDIIAGLTALARDKTVLEIACGTGYFTRFVGPVSRRTVATDVSEEMLSVARSLRIPRTRIVNDDAYRLEHVGGERFDFGFAMHWASHIPRARWAEFFTTFHARLQPGATVMLVDDIRRPNDADPWYSKLATRDTYEIRHLPNGGDYEIVKTFFSAEDLRARLEPYAANLQLRYERPRWWLTYQTLSTQPRLGDAQQFEPGAAAARLAQ